MPLVTIALPAYNAAATLSLAISSILAQTLYDWELIILDDGSTDQTIQIANEFKDHRIIIICDSQNKGISARLNQAVMIAKGKYFCRMDADDISFPRRLEIQIAFLEANLNIDLTASSVLVFNNGGTANSVIPVETTHKTICKRPFKGFYFPHPTWMGKIEWFRENSYLPSSDGAEDQVLLYSSFRKSFFAGQQEILLAYREDTRSFKKMFKRRVVFWAGLSKIALENGYLLDVLFLFLLQPIKIIGDFLNLKTGISIAKNKICEVSPSIEYEWSQLKRNLHFDKNGKI